MNQQALHHRKYDAVSFLTFFIALRKCLLQKVCVLKIIKHVVAVMKYKCVKLY